MVAQQRAHGGPLASELAETDERPVLDGRFASQLADRAGTDGAFQVGVQVSLGQQAEISHRQDSRQSGRATPTSFRRAVSATAHGDRQPPTPDAYALIDYAPSPVNGLLCACPELYQGLTGRGGSVGLPSVAAGAVRFPSGGGAWA